MKLILILKVMNLFYLMLERHCKDVSAYSYCADTLPHTVELQPVGFCIFLVILFCTLSVINILLHCYAVQSKAPVIQ